MHIVVEHLLAELFPLALHEVSHFLVLMGRLVVVPHRDHFSIAQHGLLLISDSLALAPAAFLLLQAHVLHEAEAFRHLQVLLEGLISLAEVAIRIKMKSLLAGDELVEIGHQVLVISHVLALQRKAALELVLLRSLLDRLAQRELAVFLVNIVATL